MEFTDYKCPVCGRQFKKNDDIVVCPECGAPHHRKCYEENGSCSFSYKHGENFSFEKEQADEQAKEREQDTDEGFVTCKQCGTENPRELFYCSKCGASLLENQSSGQNENRRQSNQSGSAPPFGVPFGGAQNSSVFDPMAGMKSDEPIADGVTAGEAAKFIGKNTQYHLRIFSMIQKFGRSHLNMAAFLLSGIYFLYRKMYALGIVLSTAMLAVVAGAQFIKILPQYKEVYQTVLNALENGQVLNYRDLFGGLTPGEFFLYISPMLLNVMQLVIMVISALVSNRLYFKHSVKKIKKIKDANVTENIGKVLETKGGVNLPLALSVGAAYFVVQYMPLFFG